jgi:succinate-semialdehyde dehydrogenase / glutarate-semialdehyde dehydrogenase
VYEGLGLYIDGAWRQGSGGRMQAVVDPATERSIGAVPIAEEADVEAAIAAAEKARHGWVKVNAWERAAIIRRIGDLIRARADTFSHMVAMELGRPLKHVAGEIGLAADQFEWFAEETKRLYGQTVESRQPNGRIVISHEPVGVVAAFTAWNFPLVLLARKIAPALAAGCSIICRPSEETPGSAMLLIKCCHDAGTPPGLVNLVLGKASVIAAVVMRSRAVRKISLTGSIDVGKQLFRQSADTLKRMSMELGGHAPVIVCADSDAVKAAEITVPVKFRNAGQVCVSPSRFYIHESKLDDFTSCFVGLTKKLKIGSPLDPNTDVGPLGTSKRLSAVEGLVAETRAAGAKLECGGQRPHGFNAGHYFEPTVFSACSDDMRIMREEPFGPVVPISSFTNVDEVIERSNAIDYGLASYVFTRDAATANEISSQLKAGMVGINTYALAAAEAPFGGVHDSGFGREGGSYALRDYVEPKYVHFVPQ